MARPAKLGTELASSLAVSPSGLLVECGSACHAQLRIEFPRLTFRKFFQHYNGTEDSHHKFYNWILSNEGSFGPLWDHISCELSLEDKMITFDISDTIDNKWYPVFYQMLIGLRYSRDFPEFTFNWEKFMELGLSEMDAFLLNHWITHGQHGQSRAKFNICKPNGWHQCVNQIEYFDIKRYLNCDYNFFCDCYMSSSVWVSPKLSNFMLPLTSFGKNSKTVNNREELVEFFLEEKERYLND
jgi:hypothetical protein